MSGIIEKFKNKPLREAELEYEGVKFRLRELRDASQLADLMQQISMLPPVAKVRFGDEEVSVSQRLATAIKTVKACLVEPELTEQELLELSRHSGMLIFKLEAKALELLGFLSLGNLEDFFAQQRKGSGGEA